MQPPSRVIQSDNHGVMKCFSIVIQSDMQAVMKCFSIVIQSDNDAVMKCFSIVIQSDMQAVVMQLWTLSMTTCLDMCMTLTDIHKCSAVLSSHLALQHRKNSQLSEYHCMLN
jgi:hypothetical protein